jgi:hypothetical protein
LNSSTQPLGSGAGCSAADDWGAEFSALLELDSHPRDAQQAKAANAVNEALMCIL